MPNTLSDLKYFKVAVLGPALLLGLSLSLSACGGGNMTQPQVGPQAILNGNSLKTATSHWSSTKCRSQIELTSDFGFWSVVVNNAGDTYQGVGLWTASVDGDGLTDNLGGGLSGYSWVSALKSIQGSTASQSFTATVITEVNDTPQNLGTCTFTLVSKGLS